MDRPYTILSCAMSLDGCIDDTGPDRLRLSNTADFDEVDALRADCDAILVGAGTLRSDDPRLLVRSAERRRRRIAEGRTGDLVKVVLSASGDLDPDARFFTTGDAGKVVYTGGSALEKARTRLSALPGTEVADAGDPLRPERILADLALRGVRRLLVEGGTRVHTLFLTAGLADELRLAIAPFFIGEPGAPRFTGPGAFANGPGAPLRLAQTRAVGDIAVLRYLRADAA
ncbi:RibD family protein [Nocardiopsis mangrovi]|uniref:RibD family protein n=1 Tax=Nocardiopsis mangrovi TaxID=1179818 RepID=A0ABV9DPY5_9ACTN